LKKKRKEMARGVLLNRDSDERPAAATNIFVVIFSDAIFTMKQQQSYKNNNQLSQKIKLKKKKGQMMHVIWLSLFSHSCNRISTQKKKNVRHKSSRQQQLQL
jgi:hypothetical protein